MNNYDVLIIGGGIVGTSIARELSRYRLRIALLEKETELAFGVSKSNSGIIHPGTQNSPDSLKGRLCVRGNYLTRTMAKEIGVDFKEVGELIVAFTEEERAKLSVLKQQAETLGVPRLKMVDKKWLIKNEPNINLEIVCALFAPTAGIVSPYRWVYDLSENAKRNGVDVFTEHCVTEIKYNPMLGEKRFAVTVKTKEQYCSRYLINAAGLFADDVARMLGIQDITIYPRKGEEFLLDKKREYITNHLIFPLPTEKSKGTLVIKTSDGNPMIGPTAEDIDDKEDLSTTDMGFEKVMSSVTRLIPAIDKNDIISYFAGVRPVCGDDFIVRHETNVTGCVTVAGIQSPGLTAAPAIAEYVRNLLKNNGCRLKKKMRFLRHRKPSTHLFAVPFSKTRQLIKKDSSYGDIVCRCEMVSAKEIRDAIARGAKTLDGIKFRTRAGAGRCHGSFCTTRLMKILAEERNIPLADVTKRGQGSEIVLGDRTDETS